MFKVITYSPLHLINTALAIETVKADSIALFDLEYCENSSIEKAIENLKYTLSVMPKNATIGVKSPFSKIASFKKLIELLIGHRSILVLSDLSSSEKVDVPVWISGSDIEIWGEITSKSQQWIIDDPRFRSIIIKGSESGGSIGSESSFVLSAHLIPKSKKPVYVQGGVGFHTAAACFVAGAKGVIVDDHLLAMEQSPLPIQWKKKIGNLAIENTLVIKRNNKRYRIVNHPFFKDSERIGWGHPTVTKWPVGQAIGFAHDLASEFKTVGRLINAILAKVMLNVKEAKAHQPLAPNSKLSESHGTRFPIVQGPMTRVSDVPNFIDAVAKSGGLPFLALSMISGDAVLELLEETKTKLGEKPWGVGILGFVSEELRVHQFNQIKKVIPPFALIAGGTVDQVHEFEQEGIPAYIHAPAPSLLKIFLDKGCRRFVFEGSECGGHVGPSGSFTLWESAIKMLLELPKVEAEQIHVLFAGGIYNDISASMIAAMSGQLASKGVKIGVLMGTAYLFTSEVCESGAILPRFQQTAIDCETTAVIETSPGHTIRCAETPFIQEFEAEKEKGNEDLENLTLGRLRIASKGIKRNVTGELVKISEKEQYDNGMFMLGEVAGMMNSLTSMEDLHVDVSKKGNELLSRVELPKESIEEVKASNVAIVGISTILPRAASPDNFWSNIINKVDAITEIPLGRWDWKIYYDEDKKKRDKIYSKWGGFIDDVIFDPLKFGIPPHYLKSISPAQLLLLEAVDRALNDAGYGDGGYDNEQTSIIVGSDGASSLRDYYTLRTTSRLSTDLLTSEDFERLPEWNEESFPGILTNLLAGRIANRFNFGGSNFTVDSACASSLTAIDLAIKELEHGNSNMVIVAGADIAQTPFSYTAFSKTQALSPTGKSQPFNKDGNGIVISEGIGVVLLKRLEDAERDGDKIYCVIKGAANSSDGKGLGLTAPRSVGQEKALNRAYRKAGYSPSTIGNYEAHGTGTTVGDKVELESINNVLENAGAKDNSCAVGSVKSLIGHTKTAAGIIGLIKSALSLHYQTLAPHPMNGEPLDLLNQNTTPVYLLEEARPWFKDALYPRRAGISAFGFGGTNTHVTLEEYRKNTTNDSFGHKKWPAELFVFEALTPDEMLTTVNTWATALKDGLTTALKDLSFISFNESQAQTNSKVKLSIVAEDHEGLLKSLERVMLKLSKDSDLLLPPQITLNLNLEPPEGKLGFIFPGQGSQYSNMARENTLYFKELRAVIDLANDKLNGSIKMDKLLFPITSFNQETTDYWQNKLRATENAQPAIGTTSLGYFNFLKSLEINPEAVAGHSYGEFSALHAAGVISSNDLFAISEKRGTIMAGGCEVDGTMAVVAETADEIKPYLNTDVYIANINAPKQTVISGERNAVYQVMAEMKKNGLKTKKIDVAGPFHTPFFKTAQESLAKAINGLSINSPKVPLYSNTTGKAYPQDVKLIAELLNQHLLSPVLFSNQIEQMYQDGVRFFLEVGPNKVLTGLIDQILEGKSHKAIAVEGQGGGVKGLLSAVGAIYTAGFEMSIENLYEGRIFEMIKLSDAIKESRKLTYSSATVLLHGGGVRKFSEEVAISGNLPLFDASTRNEIEDVEVLNLSRLSGQMNENNKLLEGYKSYQQTMQQFLASQETMMVHFLNGEPIPHQQLNVFSPPLTRSKLDQISQEEEAIGSKEIDATKISVIEREKSANRQDIFEKMIEIISELTGYPSEILNEDLDLEAELGVDSIKRMEILDKILKELPTDHESKLQGCMTQLMRAKTINEFLAIAFNKKIVESLNEVKQATAKDVIGLATTQESSVVASPENAYTETCARFVMESIIQELPYTGDPVLTGVHLITADSGNIAKMVAKKIAHFGGTPIILEEDILLSFELLESELLILFTEHPVISSVIHCAPLSKVSMPKELKGWKELTQIQSKSLFQVLRFAALEVEKFMHFPIRKVITTSSFGGYFGRKNKASNGLPSSGGNAGMLKALGKERTDIDIKVLDFDSLLLESEVANRIVRELAHTSEEIEIGYPDGERMIFYPVSAELEEQGSSEDKLLEENSVVLATGGAKGITAEITKSMMVPGMRIIIVGRSKEMDLELTTEGGTNTSFQQLIEQGVDVEYFSVDVKDDQAFKKLIEYIYSTYGRLDAVIHGAGIIEDDHIEQKGIESFNNVFDTKVDTAFLLFKYLRPESLKLLVFFGSVSGRFGNQGQTDYAAANEVLNRFAWYLHQKWPNTRTLTINWGPWSMIGMASPMVIRLLKSQGMEPIHPQEGCNFFLREIRQGNTETSEVIAGTGPWGNLNEAIFDELELEHIFNQTGIFSFDLINEE